jgi:hypothetical protein
MDEWCEDKPGRGVGLEASECVVEIVFVIHVAEGAEVDALTHQTLPPDAGHAVLLTAVAYDVVVSETNGRVV